MKVLTALTCLLPLISLGVMVKSSIEGAPLVTFLAALCCYTGARSALLLIRLSSRRAQEPPSPKQ